MDDHLAIFTEVVPKSEEEIVTLQDIFETYSDLKNIDLENGHEFTNPANKGKKIPSLKFAIEEDAEEITKIFKEVYEDTYPYKLMESVSDIISMIRDPNYYWIVFKLKPNITIGCIGIRLNFESKIGNFFGFAFRKKYHHKVDIATASIACMVAPVYKFKDRILVWFAEIRSSYSSIQYLAKSAGLLPVAFLPNKDIFFKHPESEILFVIYDKNCLFKCRSARKPELISQAIFCYFHAFQKYGLDLPTIRNYENLRAELDQVKVNNIKKNLLKKVEIDKFGNKLITFSLMGTNSYCQFLYYKDIKIVEKTKFSVATLEELYIFLEEIKLFIFNSKIRYFETYLSAYNSKYQALFFSYGFKPTGYIPAFNYNTIELSFEDQVLFVYHEKNLYKSIYLIPETEEFLKTIKYLKELKKS